MGTADLTFWVPGAPVTQGSKRLMRGRMIEVTGARLAVWREAVAYGALGARPRGWKPLVGPVAVDVEFRLPRPKKPQWEFPAVKGRNDLDKLVRAVGDALTGIAFEDDGQIVDWAARKRYAVDSEVGARVWVRRMIVPGGS